MNYKNILEVADAVDCDCVEISLARALILEEISVATLEEHPALVHVKFQKGLDFVLPTSKDKHSVKSRVTQLVLGGADIIVPPSLVDSRWIPNILDFTFVGDSATVANLERSPRYSRFSKDPDVFRTVPLHTKGYDPEGTHVLFLEWCKESKSPIPEYEKRAVERLLEGRPWFADLVGLKGLILQERVEIGESTIWEPKGCIITAQLSKRRWGVLYRFGVAEGAATYLTSRSASSYFTPKFDDGCSRGDKDWHFFKSLLTDDMIPLFQATGKSHDS